MLQLRTSHLPQDEVLFYRLTREESSGEHHRALYVLPHSERVYTSPQTGVWITQDAVERGWFTEDCSMCRGVVDFQRALALAQQIAEGMAFLHANNIVHGVRGGLRSRVFCVRMF